MSRVVCPKCNESLDEVIRVIRVTVEQTIHSEAHGLLVQHMSQTMLHHITAQAM